MFLRSTGQEQPPPQIGGQTNQTKRPGWEWMGGARSRREPLHKPASQSQCRHQFPHTLGKDADAQDETASRGPDTPFQRDPVLQSLHITSHDSQIFPPQINSNSSGDGFSISKQERKTERNKNRKLDHAINNETRKVACGRRNNFGRQAQKLPL